MARNSQNVIQFISPTDNQLLKFLVAVVDNSSDRVLKITITTAPGFNVTPSLDDSILEIKNDLEKNGKGREIRSVVIQGKPFPPHNRSGSFTFDRGVTQGGTVTPSSTHAEILFNNPTHDPELSVAVSLNVEKHFKKNLESSTGNHVAADLGIFVTQLAEVSTGIAEQLAGAQILAAKKSQEQLDKIAEKAAEQNAEIEKTRATVEAALAKKEQALEKRVGIENKRLAKLEADLLNDRARSERRGLRASITDDLKERQKEEVTPFSAKILRAPILILSIIGVVASLYFAYLSFGQFAELAYPQPTLIESSAVTSSVASWVLASLIFRGSLGILVATVFGVYILRYLRDLEDAATRRAVELERNLFDIDRASWVIETIMELREEEGITTVPEHWLRGATHNLFGSHTSDEIADVGPLDSLGELLAAGAKLKVGKGSAEMEMSPKASKKIAKN